MVAYVHCIWLMGGRTFGTCRLGQSRDMVQITWRRFRAWYSCGCQVDIFKRNRILVLDSRARILGNRFWNLAGLGLFTRLAMLAAWFMTLMTVHRMTGFLFGLDQIVIMLSFYLCIAKSNDAGSLDRWLLNRFPKLFQSTAIKLLTGLQDVGSSGPQCRGRTTWLLGLYKFISA